MSKKNKDKNKKPFRHPLATNNSNSPIQFRNLAAERQLDLQISRATTLYQNKQGAAALEILEPLAVKFPQNRDLLDLLAVCYGGVGLYDKARDTFERVLPLTSKLVLPLTRYNLAQMYLETGYPALAYAQCQLFECRDLARLNTKSSFISDCVEFKEACSLEAHAMVESNAKVFDDFLPCALAIEHGRVAMSRGDNVTARTNFLEAIRLDPGLANPHNNLALLYMRELDTDNAIKECHYVLEKLDANNLHALSNMVRLLTTIGATETEIAQYVKRVKVLPPADISSNKGCDDIVKLAETYALVEDDQAVFDLMQPYFDDQVSLARLATMPQPLYQQLVILAVVAAANLVRTVWATEILWQHEKSSNSLLERTRQAVLMVENGPRPQGRFYYFDPGHLYLPAVKYLHEEVGELLQTGETTTEAIFKAFLGKYGNAAVDILVFRVWVAEQSEMAEAFMNGLLVSGRPEGIEAVRRLALTKAGDTQTRVLAAKILLKEGHIGSEERITIWLGQETHIGTVAELNIKYQSLAQAGELTTQAAVPELYDPQAADLANEALQMYQRGDNERAIALYQQAIARDPGIKTAHYNLGSLLAASGDDKLEEAMAHIQKALEIDPNYVHARIGMARLRLESGDINQAEEQLEVLEPQVDNLLADEQIAFYNAQIELYRRTERFEKMAAIARRLLELDPTNPLIQKQAATLSLLEAVSGVTRMIEQNQVNYQAKRLKQWGNTLAAAPALEVTTSQLVPVFSKDELLTVLQTWQQIQATQSQSLKEELVNSVLKLLTDPATYQETTAELLDEKARHALAVLLETGGHAPYEEWRQKANFEDELAEVDLRNKYKSPAGLPGRLMALGLVYVGNVDDYAGLMAGKKTGRKNSPQLVAVVPADLRFMLRQWLSVTSVSE